MLPHSPTAHFRPVRLPAVAPQQNDQPLPAMLAAPHIVRLPAPETDTPHVSLRSVRPVRSAAPPGAFFNGFDSLRYLRRQFIPKESRRLAGG